MSNRVLVTGGLGYVGSRLVPQLLQEGYHVKVLDLNLYGDYGYQALKNDPEWENWRQRFELIIGDIRDPDAVNQAMSQVDSVVHLAAISNDPTGELDEILTKQVNFDAVGLLVSTARSMGIRRFINASSSSVFGERGESDINEVLEPLPISAYSRYKMLAEWVIRTAAGSDFCAVNVRPATICGWSPRQRLDLTVNKLTADAVKKGVITVHGGTQRRPNTGMADMVAFYSLLLRTDSMAINGYTFNFGFENLTVAGIAEKIKDMVGPEKVRINTTETFDRRDYHICSEKVKNSLGYEPVSGIENEVRILCEKIMKNSEFEDIDADRFYNLKVMKMDRNGAAYSYLGGNGWKV